MIVVEVKFPGNNQVENLEIVDLSVETIED